jgi:hypothetical protein
MRIRPAALLFTAAFVGVASRLPAQTPEPVRLVETFAPGSAYHVNCRVRINGWLTLPPDKGQPAGKKLDVRGESKIEYDERVLEVKEQRVDRTVRFYRRMDFNRKVGGEEQQSSLRPDVRRLVILRHKQFEVPFAPAGPLLWSEIDLVRTDVFTPALKGLLPANAVRPGDSWAADPAAVQELTDLERITSGTLTCTFKERTVLAGRDVAGLAFQGTVGGIGEDGPARHQLEGTLYFDLRANRISYVTVQGTQALLDKDGKESGTIQGTFVLTREPEPTSGELTDTALKGVELTPNENNTRLLFDQADLGVRFLYPRRWHIAGVNGRQIGLDEKHGNGLLITIEPLANVPSAAQLQQETRATLAREKVTVVRTDGPRQLRPGVDLLALDTQEKTGQRVKMLYFLIRQPTGGAVLTARLLAGDGAAVQADVEAIARSFQLRQPK